MRLCTKDRVLGGTKFCYALHKFAGDSSAQDPNHQPKDFVEEIDDVMDMFEEVRKQTVEPGNYPLLNTWGMTV